MEEGIRVSTFEQDAERGNRVSPFRTGRRIHNSICVAQRFDCPRFVRCPAPHLTIRTSADRSRPIDALPLDEAVAGIEAIRGDYDHHSRAARRLAEEYFESGKVLNRLLQKLEVQ